MADVLIIGGGIAGTNAAMIALGMGAQVTLLDRSLDVLRRVAMQFGGRVRTIFSTRAAIAELVAEADLEIGRGARAGLPRQNSLQRTAAITSRSGLDALFVTGQMHGDSSRRG